MTAIEDARSLIAEHERQARAFDGYAETIRAAQFRAERAEREVERLTADLAARDADDVKRSEEGRTDWDYQQRIDRLSAEVARLTAPPSDDEREALALIVKRIAQKFGGPSMAEFENDPPIRKHYATAEAILSAGFRRQGPITPAKAWEEGRIAGGKHALDIQARLNAGEPSPPSLTNPYEAEQ